MTPQQLEEDGEGKEATHSQSSGVQERHVSYVTTGQSDDKEPEVVGSRRQARTSFKYSCDENIWVRDSEPIRLNQKSALRELVCPLSIILTR